jgi:DNA-binding HxlR family transcriptional regulator
MNNENKLCTASVFTEKLGGKWKLSIIYHLSGKSLRFGQLAAVIDGISRKVLTDHLNQLVADKLINRESFKETPPRVEYSLTDAAIKLQPVLKSIDSWVRESYT